MILLKKNYNLKLGVPILGNCGIIVFFTKFAAWYFSDTLKQAIPMLSFPRISVPFILFIVPVFICIKDWLVGYFLRAKSKYFIAS